jgi:Ca-activated chloride channel family protein
VAPLSTFSIDVDTASYANVRRFLNSGQLPPANAVRIEELINYFPYADKPPVKSLEEGGDPFAVHMEQTVAPWSPDNRLLRIALKGYEMPWEERPASNLVFLLDVSGSMSGNNKLPLVQKSMNLLVNKLDGRDRVAIVVYAGASGLVLPSTTANNRDTIAHAIRNLRAGGSTNAGAGIELAYETARQHFIEDGNNRVILCTDGDFNVGLTDRGSLASVAEAQAEQGVSLTILGFGMGNFKDGMLEELSNKGKGSYAYIDSEYEGRKVFLQELASNLFKIAKDVKIQVEFNPVQVSAYRLIGYENRRLKAEDFNNDRKKAGDIGPGHSVVALYEVIPANIEADLPVVDALKYQSIPRKDVRSSELATVKLRYKLPDVDLSKLIVHSVDVGELVDFVEAPEDLRFSASVAAFGMKLSKSKKLGDFSYREIEQIAAGAIGRDPGGYRSEFTGLVRKAAMHSKRSASDKE